MSTNLSLPAQVESLLPIEVSVMLRGRMGDRWMVEGEKEQGQGSGFRVESSGFRVRFGV